MMSSQPYIPTQPLTQLQPLIQAPTIEGQSPSATDILTAPVAELQSLALSLFHALSPTQARPPPVPPLAAFLDVDARLAAAVKLARTHQIRQRRIERLKDDVVRLEDAWRESVRELMDGRTKLDEVLAEAEERVKAIEQAKAAAIPYPELLAYAQSLSAFTSAPPTMPDAGSTMPGQPPPPLIFPPFPNEEKMRRGRMNAEAPLALLGETHSVGRAPTLSPGAVDHLLPAAANPYRPEDHRMAHEQVFDLDLDLNPDL